MRHQIDYEVLPEEALLGADIVDSSLTVGQEQYHVLIFPRCEYLPDRILEWCDEALAQGLTIVMDEQAPKYQSTQESYPDLRYYHYRQPRGDLFLFFNESVGETVETVVSLPIETENVVFQYDAWENRLYRAVSESDGVSGKCTGRGRKCGSTAKASVCGWLRHIRSALPRKMFTPEIIC